MKVSTATSPDTANSNDVQEFLRVAHKRFATAEKAESDIRAASLDDLRFRAGEQWPSDIKQLRINDQRPYLVMDRTEQFIRQICNQQREQAPSLQVNPVGDGADVDTAEIEQGLIRHIEVQSLVEQARGHAFEMMVTMGFGYYRVTIEANDETGALEIYQRRIKNAFSVYFDPNAQEPDYSDARWCFVTQDLPRDDYDSEYDETRLASLREFSSIGDNTPGWMSSDNVRVAEYFYVEGKGKDRKVKWAKINAIECIEGGPDDEIEWPGKWIPIIPVLGVDLDVNGERYLAGLVRKLKDPQRQYNYMNSGATEAIALAPKAPWQAAEGQIEGYEEIYALSNLKNYSVLPYKPVAVGGTIVGPPIRVSAEPPIQAMMLMVRQASEDLQAAAGMYNAYQGSASPSDHSGKAILARQKQADITNLNWTDNLSRSMWHEGRILLDLIPKVYTESEVRRIINPDGSAKNVGIVNNVKDEQAREQVAQQLNVDKVYDIGVGTYDVTVSVGPSYQTRRQEAVASQLAFIEAAPWTAEIVSDITTADMDWPQAREVSARLKRFIASKYPNLIDDDAEGPEAQLQKLQAQVSQMQPILQQQGQLIQQQHQMLEGKMLEQQTKKEIEMARIQAEMAGKQLQYETQLAVAQINASKDANQAYADREMQVLQMGHDAAHDVAMGAVAQQNAQQQMAQQQAMQQPQQAESPNSPQEQPNGTNDNS